MAIPTPGSLNQTDPLPDFAPKPKPVPSTQGERDAAARAQRDKDFREKKWEIPKKP